MIMTMMAIMKKRRLKRKVKSEKWGQMRKKICKIHIWTGKENGLRKQKTLCTWKHHISKHIIQQFVRKEKKGGGESCEELRKIKYKKQCINQSSPRVSHQGIKCEMRLESYYRIEGPIVHISQLPVPSASSCLGAYSNILPPRTIIKTIVPLLGTRRR